MSSRDDNQDLVNPPMDNNKQAVDIKGYRILSDLDKAVMNSLKETEQNVLAEIDKIKELEGANPRSVSIAIHHIQTGFMWVIRAIARPNGE